MRILREKRLNHELMNGVCIFQLRDKLYADMHLAQDNDHLVQAIDINKDIKILDEWIMLDEELEAQWREMNDNPDAKPFH